MGNSRITQHRGAFA